MTDRAMSEALRLADRLLAETSKFGKPSIQRGLLNEAIQELRCLHAENEALRAQVERLRLMQPVIIGPTGQSNMLTAGEIDAIDAARKEST